MALVAGDDVTRIDSFDHLTNVLTKYPNLPSMTNVPDIEAGEGRGGAQALKFLAGDDSYFEYDAADLDDSACGYYARIPTYPDDKLVLWRQKDDTGANLLHVYLHDDGHISVADESSTLYSSSAGAIALDTYTAVECHYDNLGTARVYVGHTLLTTQTGLGSPDLGVFQIGNMGDSGVDWYMTELYVAKDLILQPWQVISRFPQGAGEFSEWAPNGSTPNYACVDDLSVPDDANSDSDWVESLSSPTPEPEMWDIYDFGDLPAGIADVFAVQWNLRTAGTEGATANDAAMQYEPTSSGLFGVGPFQVDADAYQVITFSENPAPVYTIWTAADINTFGFGIYNGGFNFAGSVTLKVAQMAMEFLVTGTAVAADVPPFGYITRTLPWSQGYVGVIEDGSDAPVVRFEGDRIVDEIP